MLSTLRLGRKEGQSKGKEKRRQPELRLSLQSLPAPKQLGEVVSQVQQSRHTEVGQSLQLSLEGDPHCVFSGPQNLAVSHRSLCSHANYVAPKNLFAVSSM